MTVISCNECKGQVSTEAETCPHCGADIQKKYRPIIIGTNEDVIFYNLVRTTIQGLDNLRINTIIPGMTFVSSMYVAAILIA